MNTLMLTQLTTQTLEIMICELTAKIDSSNSKTRKDMLWKFVYEINEVIACRTK